jgi:hypothetical protein
VPIQPLEETPPIVEGAYGVPESLEEELVELPPEQPFEPLEEASPVVEASVESPEK